MGSLSIDIKEDIQFYLKLVSRFLKESGCYRSFIKNYNNKAIGVRYRKHLYLNFYANNDYSEYTLKNYVKKIFLNGDATFLIDFAFDSQYTKENYKYWSNLSYEWNCWLQENILRYE